MLSEKRIKEAENNVKQYLDDGLLRRTENDFAQNIFTKNAKESFKAAKILLENKIYLWTIVSAYYSMFYISNAVLIKNKYKTADKIVHKVTADSLIALIRTKLKNKLIENYEEVAEEALNIAEIKSNELLETFDFERKKRNTIQYQTTQEDIETKARTSLKRAKEFIFEIEKLLL
jgi:uncharacterized protein (UPF0332 family)